LDSTAVVTGRAGATIEAYQFSGRAGTTFAAVASVMPNGIETPVSLCTPAFDAQTFRHITSISGAHGRYCSALVEWI
jgi:hypothetical protein